MADAMATGENDVAENDRKEVVADDGSSQNSPWKKPVLLPIQSLVMGEKIWPSLTDVQSPNAAVTLYTDSQGTQNLDGHKKSNDGINGNSSPKHFQTRYYRGKPKNSQNTGPPFPVPVVPRLPCPPPGSFLPPVRGYENFYQPMPVPFPVANNCFTKPGSQIPKNSFISPLPNMDDGQNFHPQARGDVVVNPPKYSAERACNTAEFGGYYCFPRPLPFGPKGSINMPENMNMAPRAYMSPASFRPPMLIGGPPYPGMRYCPMPPFVIRTPIPPWITPNFVNPCVPPPEVLKKAIVQQIEYYFSDENLPTDHYLLSQMDDQGWVPISVIAEFKRLKSKCTDVNFILDALKWSSSVEVKGNKLRRYNTSKNAEKSPANDFKDNSSCQDSTTSSGSGANKQPDTSSPTGSSDDINTLTEEAELLFGSAVNTEKPPSVISSGLTA